MIPKQPDLLILKLIDKLDDADPLIRRNAAGALRLQGLRAVAAIPALLALLSDLDPRVRNEAERALDHLRLKARPNRRTSVRSTAGEISASERTIRSAWANASGLRPVLSSATLAIPAAAAAATPAGASSMTTHRDGGMLSPLAANRKTSGSGLPRVTSAPVTTA